MWSTALWLLACSPDTDGDGLTNAEERDLGSDPELADTDGDGLSDGEEAELGTDPVAVDTDGDGYSDASEVREDSDPLDPQSVVYVGGWPYNPDKDAIVDPGWETMAAVGNTLPRFAWRDQYGDTVDIYDLAGRPMVVDLSGLWCSWCHEVATWLEGEEAYYDAWPQYAHIPSLVSEGTIVWVTALDSGYDPAIPANDLDQAVWVGQHENPAIPVLRDDAQQLKTWLGAQGYPSMWMVDEDMTIQVWDPETYVTVFDAVVEQYPQ
jgi:hypothetical protein